MDNEFCEMEIKLLRVIYFCETVIEKWVMKLR